MMNLIKRFVFLHIMLVCLFVTTLNAKVWTPETLPMVHLQDSTRFVCNPDHVLSDETVAKTDAILATLKLKKGVETVVVAVKQIENGDPYQFGMDLSRKYGIGNKEQRTGLIVILSTEDRAFQYLTGHGLEGTLPDGLCFQIQQDVMVPALKAGDWDKAIYESVVALNGIIMGDETITRKYEPVDDSFTIMAIVGLIAFVIVLMLIVDFFKKRCPKCHTRNGLELVQSRRLRNSHGWYTKTTWKCKKCGHIVIRNEEENSYRNGNNSGGGFPLFGGGSGGGGGFGGGSFGGGSFGGGGSGGRF